MPRAVQFTDPARICFTHSPPHPLSLSPPLPLSLPHRLHHTRRSDRSTPGHSGARLLLGLRRPRAVLRRLEAVDKALHVAGQRLGRRVVRPCTWPLSLAAILAGAVTGPARRCPAAVPSGPAGHTARPAPAAAGGAATARPLALSSRRHADCHQPAQPLPHNLVLAHGLQVGLHLGRVAGRVDRRLVRQRRVAFRLRPARRSAQSAPSPRSGKYTSGQECAFCSRTTKARLG